MGEKKCGFIRGLWGIYDKSHRITNRRYNIDNDISSILNNKFNEPYTVYVMGIDNYNDLLKTGIKENVKLVCEEPFKFDLISHMYRNKMEIIKHALDNDFDEIVYLDWDCVPQKKIPENFWDNMSKISKFGISGCIQSYKRMKCPWRGVDRNKVINGGWLYINDKNIPHTSCDLWVECGKPDNDEIAWTKYIDNKIGGWKGVNYFFENFETPYCNLHRMSSLDVDQFSGKDVYFMHYQG